jgi:hypothetical protein
MVSLHCLHNVGILLDCMSKFRTLATIRNSLTLLLHTYKVWTYG